MPKDLITFSAIRGARTGNVLFWLAATYAYALRNNLSIVVPPYDKTLFPEVHNVLTHTNVPYRISEVGNYLPIRYCNHAVDGHNKPIPSGLRNCCIEGWFQNELYFKDYEKEIKEAYSNLISKESKPGQLNIHIRLTDYIKYKGIYRVTSPVWLCKALNELDTFHSIKLFSDDIKVATPIFSEAVARSKHAPSRFELIIDDHKEPLECIKAMTEGDYFIVCNSSFSWWGAWLGNFKKVIAPTPWLNKQGDNGLNTICKDWIPIAR